MTITADDQAVGGRGWLVEHRYRAVLQVQQGAPISQVAREVGASRQSVYSWVARYKAEGLAGLTDRSRRPHTSPTRMSAEVEALICELRRTYPRWGARRIAHEVVTRGVSVAPGRSSVYRVLVRHGLVEAQKQNHKRKYRRWQRDAPMQLWQMDIMGGVFLADGRECKLVTGIDDHSRFVVIAKVVTEPSGRAVCAAFTEAMARYGVPSEVLTDKLLDAAGPFADLAAAQAALDAWVHGYNHSRPHQSLAMNTPASVFRPAPLEPATPKPPLDVPISVASPAPPTHGLQLPALPASLTTPVDDRDVPAVEWGALLSPIGRLCLPGNQQIKFAAALANRTVTVWADDRSIHVLLDGHLIRTRPSRFSVHDLRELLLRGGRIAGPEPGAAALPSGALPVTSVIELDRTVGRDGDVGLGGQRVTLDPSNAHCCVGCF